MKIKILKETPYRKGYEKEIKINEEHEVNRVCKSPIYNVLSYHFIVDGRERMVLESDCKVVEI